MLLIAIAFISGVLTVLSPCILPILPVVLASGIDGNKRRVKGIVLGIVVSFVVLSLFLATLIRLAGISADAVRGIAIIILILLGLVMMIPDIWERIQTGIEKKWRFKPVQNRSDGFGSGLITGVSLGVIWTPCIGPIVAAVATLAAISSFNINGIFVILFYALGTVLPLYFIAVSGGKFVSRLGFIKSKSIKIRQIFGLIIFGTALLIWSGADRAIQGWTISNFPKAWTQLSTTFEERFKDSINNDPAGNAEPGTTVIKDVGLQNDFNGAKVKKGDLLQGCFGKDCIPSIDDPQFETAEQADSWLNSDDVVFAVNFNGEVRAYPQRILNWHEIVNDKLGDTPVAITFCPLCGSALAFERIVDGVITEFGVSGKLHNNDLVMYDRYEGNLWQQITGEAIVGPAARRNELLEQIPIITVDWGKWKSENPSTVVLSRETGFSRNYDHYPYGTYEKDDTLLFGVNELDKSLQIKTVVYGIELPTGSSAYPENLLIVGEKIEDVVGGVHITIEKLPDGKVEVINNETGEEIIPIRLFWFAWAAFHPDTQLYSQ